MSVRGRLFGIAYRMLDSAAEAEDIVQDVWLRWQTADRSVVRDEAFDYAYRDIANVLRLEEANARQVVTRARQHVAGHRRTPANSTQEKRLLEAFTAAAQHGDVTGLEGLLSSDVVSTADAV